MKKIFGISLVSILTALPMFAGAEVVAGDPGATTSSAAAADYPPQYALKNSADTDTNAATAGYVKGAYNAIIKGINATQGEIDTINTNIGTYENTVSHLLDNTATQSGTVATINAATSTEQIASSSVNITGVTTSSISATASGNVNLSVPVMDKWASSFWGSGEPVQTTTSFSGLAVNGLAMSAPGTNNTATLTKTGIGGTISVSGYTLLFDFSTLDININQSGTPSYNNTTKTWSVPFSYGTVSGTAVCSKAASSARGGTASTIDTSATGGSCWCKMTEFNNGRAYNQPSAWVFNYTYTSYSKCTSGCASSCGGQVGSLSVMRAGLYGLTPEQPFDFSTLRTGTNGTSYTADETAKTWSTTFSYGTVSGAATCSTTEGSAIGGTASTIDTSATGDYCWCKMTEFNNGIIYNQSSAWVFSSFLPNNDCQLRCARDCASHVYSVMAVRSGMYGSVQ